MKAWAEHHLGLILPAACILWAVSPFFYYSFATFYIPPREGFNFKVPPGATLREIASGLQERGITRHPYIFMELAVIMGGQEDLKAGTYQFEGELSLFRVAGDIINGRVATREITIPEGYDLSDIINYLCRTTGADEESVRRLGNDPELLGLLGLGTPSIEGFLFPDTYVIRVDMPAREIFKLMIRRYHEVFNDSLRARAKEIGLSEVEAVTLASIIEKETGIEDERKVISGVFHNRLVRGMPLEADPTVRYAISKYRGQLTYKDLECDSPYNTYRYRGLPPGPICSPGKASIMAALHPADVDYLYFVATGDGTHTFSRTLAQHNAARRSARSRQGDRR
jgi:UPF0755 protein